MGGRQAAAGKPVQLSLFAEESTEIRRKKAADLERTVDRIEREYGRGTVRRARKLGGEKAKEDGE